MLSVPLRLINSSAVAANRPLYLVEPATGLDAAQAAARPWPSPFATVPFSAGFPGTAPIAAPPTNTQPTTAPPTTTPPTTTRPTTARPDAARPDASRPDAARQAISADRPDHSRADTPTARPDPVFASAPNSDAAPFAAPDTAPFPDPSFRTIANAVQRPRPVLALAPSPAPSTTRQALTPLGQILLDMGALTAADLVRALAMQTREDARLGDILIAQGMVQRAQLLSALALQWKARVIDPLADPPDTRLIDRLGLAICLRDGLLPWRQAGAATVIATSVPETFDRHRDRLTAEFGPVVMAISAPGALHAALVAARQSRLNTKAETLVPAQDSARMWHVGRLRRGLMAAGLVSALLTVALPGVVTVLIIGWAGLTLLACTGLRLAALIARLPDLRAETEGAFATRRHGSDLARLPQVSVMVPMYRESDIAARLIARLGRITYPHELLDIMLVVEAEDAMTLSALAVADLPVWMRVITVPPGPLKTKPRALNFALDFCRGSIVGVWDAEDAPDPDQIFRVVRRFAERGPHVACLQGVLDFYNPRSNWLSRCFTIEYATWFRVILPGMARLGLPVPLGGTTLFFRRAALESLGGWDAHNVTEDADLGIRLARQGYTTELISTVTEEEANCRAYPWVKQRSRWLKGYAMTYAVHMRRPRALLDDLGWWRFFGVQVLFVGTLSQFLLAPVLWSFWIIPFGLPHPATAFLPGSAVAVLGLLFLASEAVNLLTGYVALGRPRHRFLRAWLPTMQIYFPLGALAAWKGAWELVVCPFYWDKTMHGHHSETPAPPPRVDLVAA